MAHGIGDSLENPSDVSPEAEAAYKKMSVAVNKSKVAEKMVLLILLIRSLVYYACGTIKMVMALLTLVR